MFFMVSFSFSFSFKISSIRAPPSRRKGLSALGDQLLLAAHVGPQDGGNGHGAVGLQVVLRKAISIRGGATTVLFRVWGR